MTSDMSITESPNAANGSPSVRLLRSLVRDGKTDEISPTDWITAHLGSIDES